MAGEGNARMKKETSFRIIIIIARNDKNDPFQRRFRLPIPSTISVATVRYRILGHHDSFDLSLSLSLSLSLPPSFSLSLPLSLPLSLSLVFGNFMRVFGVKRGPSVARMFTILSHQSRESRHFGFGQWPLAFSYPRR